MERNETNRQGKPPQAGAQKGGQKGGAKGPSEEIPSRHWADTAADELIKSHPADKPQFVCASGISPSGVVHIGNFREVITVDFVVRSLRERGKNVRFIYSWDDYDAFRKVPANLPRQDMLQGQLRKPISKVTDPYGECPSYAAFFERKFEREIGQLGVEPEYIRQNEMYRARRYAAGIREALRAKDAIVAILNRARTSDLPADWTPVSVFCKSCDKDTTDVREFREPSTIAYHCNECKKDDVLDFEKEEGVKLLWRVDWPMRWAREGVDFEPGGKDHSSTGGSFDTGKEIIREVWKKEPPYYVQYDFVLAKGIGSKLSSSSGNLITVGEALEIYEPAVIRWLFASRKPNLDFSIAFDLDVMKAYDEFDRCERFAYGAEEGDEKKVTYERRIYELSVVTPVKPGGPADLPAQYPFRHLCNLLQIHEGNLDKAREYFAKGMRTQADRDRFESRAKRAWKWITTFAPEEFKFQLRPEGAPPVKTKYPEAVRALVALLCDNASQTLTEDDLAGRIFQIMKGNQLEAKAFFGDIYGILIAKANGPKLATFLTAIGLKRAAGILERSL